MLDFVAYLHAQDRTARHAREAMPDASVQPETVAARVDWRQPIHWLRERRRRHHAPPRRQLAGCSTSTR